MPKENMSHRFENLGDKEFEDVYDNSPDLRISFRATVRLSGENGNIMEAVEGHSGLKSLICISHSIELMKGFGKFREEQGGLAVHAEEAMKDHKIAVELLERIMKVHLDLLQKETGRKFYEIAYKDGTTEN